MRFEEIEEIEDLKREGISLKEEDIMKPEPSSEQVALWEEIEKNVTEKGLERDNLFGSLSGDIRNLLASEYTSNKLAEMKQKHNLTHDQIMALSRYIKNLFITFPKEEGFEITKLINLLRSDLDISPEKAERIFGDVNNKILLPTLKNIPGGEEKSEKSSQPRLTDTNIVDLKNQSRE